MRDVAEIGGQVRRVAVYDRSELREYVRVRLGRVRILPDAHLDQAETDAPHIARHRIRPELVLTLTLDALGCHVALAPDVGFG